MSGRGGAIQEERRRFIREKIRDSERFGRCFFFEVENQKCFRLWKNEQMISRLEGVNPGEKAVADWWWGWSGEAPEGEDWRMKGKCNRRETQWKGGVMKGELNKKRSNK